MKLFKQLWALLPNHCEVCRGKCCLKEDTYNPLQLTGPEIIEQIIKNGAHDSVILTDSQYLILVKSLVRDACFRTGINAHIGYEGVNRNEDLILYLHSLLKGYLK